MAIKHLAFAMVLFLGSGACLADGGGVGEEGIDADELPAHGPACHDVCSTGEKLRRKCDPCVAAVCADDGSCCKDAWSDACVAAAESLCGLDCGGGAGGSTSASTTATTTVATTSAVSSTSSGGAVDPAQHCVDTINAYRASIGLAPYARWTSAESCAGGEAQQDSSTGVAHSAFPSCGEWAQNECPGWPGPADGMIDGCLQMMWNEGPGADFATHGHYINMSSTSYTTVACGFYTLADGTVWAVQDFR